MVISWVYRLFVSFHKLGNLTFIPLLVLYTSLYTSGWAEFKSLRCVSLVYLVQQYGSAEGPTRVVENRNLLSHLDDLRKEAYLILMT